MIRRGGLERSGMRGRPRAGPRRSPGPRPPERWRVSDQLWGHLEPLLCDPPRRFHNPGRRRYPARACLEGLLFLLHTGLPYTQMPREEGLPSGETCRRRLMEWMEAGVWEEAVLLLVARLDTEKELDWSRVVIDAVTVDAKKGATKSVKARSTEENRPPSSTSASTPRAIHCGPF
jgi:transposase